jgi:hypothetical protein
VGDDQLAAFSAGLTRVALDRGVADRVRERVRGT